MLKDRLGSSIHVYCVHAGEAAEYERLNRDKRFDSVNVEVAPHSAALARVDDPQAVIGRARAWEECLGTTINFLAVANRHLGRSFSLGGFHHPRSRYSEETDYIQMLNGYVRALDFWEHEIRDKGICLFVNVTKEAAVVARTHGVPMRIMVSSRLKNLHYWAVDEYYRSPDFFRAYQATPLDAGGIDDLDILAPKTYDKARADMRHTLKRLRLAATLGEAGYWAAQRAYHALRGFIPYGGYYTWDRIRVRLRMWREYRKLMRLGVTPLAELRGIPFVFFPLQEEPESSLTIASPEYFNQLQAISVLARDLPAGIKLAVKEALFSIGRRPDNFYNQVKEFKNVVMIDPREFGTDVIREAGAVATISSSAGFEAAIMGKPVISFGKHNHYSFLPHVRVVEHEGALAGYLQEVVSNGVDLDLARREGVRFARAVIAVSFDLGRFSYYHPTNYDQEALEASFSALVQSVEAASLLRQ